MKKGIDLSNLPIESSKGKPVIICVDDEEMILSSLRFQVKKFFQDYFHIEIAHNAEIALEIIEECNQNGIELPLIISDQIMPGMKGDELLIAIHETNPKMIKIMLTGQANADAVGNALNNANLYRFIAKPWDPDDLNLTLMEAIRAFYMGKTLEEKNLELEKALTYNKRTNLLNMQGLKRDLENIKSTTRINLILIKLENHIPCMRSFGLDLYYKLVDRFLDTLKFHIDENIYHLFEDEFAIISEQSEDFIYSKINALLLLFKSDLLNVDDILFQIKLTVSIVNNNKPGEDLYHKAKVVLIASSEKAVKNLIYTQSELNETDLHSYNYTWGKKLNKSLKEGRIVPYYQGIISNKTGEINKFECLARMVENDVIYPPLHFLELAKSTGIIKTLTRMIIEKVLRVFEHNDYSFSINLTEAELEDRNFSKYIESSLNYYKISPGRLIFEVLENVTLRQDGQNLKTLFELRELGCKISIDDFGV
ncbi:MAG: EAL domain-containing protein, partial [Leptospiraceae bacterium]|nr:EAL domain-containing protein [Leptospiraceae bacterium]